MKELSIEDKAKRYDEAIKIAKEIYNENPSSGTAKVVCKQIFPELVESEDEKIIKSFIRLLKAFYDVNFPTPEGYEREDMIAWLEKQSEKSQNKSAFEATKEEKVDNRNYVKPINNIEPKFKVGDWVVNTITNEVEQIIELTDCEYICSGHLIVSFGSQHILRKLTIQDIFIEKACKWLINAFHQNSNGTFNYVGGNECTIRDIVCIFRQGMKE